MYSPPDIGVIDSNRKRWTVLVARMWKEKKRNKNKKKRKNAYRHLVGKSDEKRQLVKSKHYLILKVFLEK
jgi:hypothetical protein